MPTFYEPSTYNAEARRRKYLASLRRSEPSHTFPLSIALPLAFASVPPPPLALAFAQTQVCEASGQELAEARERDDADGEEGEEGEEPLDLALTTMFEPPATRSMSKARSSSCEVAEEDGGAELAAQDSSYVLPHRELQPTKNMKEVLPDAPTLPPFNACSTFLPGGSCWCGGDLVFPNLVCAVPGDFRMPYLCMVRGSRAPI